MSYGRATEFIYAECPVIKYRGGTVVLYPLAKYQPEVKQLHGKKVHVVINNKRIKSNHINLYENKNSRKRAARKSSALNTT